MNRVSVAACLEGKPGRFHLSPALRVGANCPARSDSDAAGQFVGKRGGERRSRGAEGAKRRRSPCGAETPVRCF
jgi:hypothetical protein